MFKIHQPTGLVHEDYAASSYKVSLNSAPSLEMLSSSDSAGLTPGKPPKPVLSSTPPELSSEYSSSIRSSHSTPPSSRANSPPVRSNRANTPPTPTSLDDRETCPKHSYSTNTLIQQQKPTRLLDDNSQDDFLNLIEPNPVAPPLYETLPPGGCPRFPIIENEGSPQEAVPSYTPSIYKIGVVSRKLEWLTPYEPAPARSWKNVIMELNSTQLNFYYVPSGLESHLLSFKPISQSPERTYNEFEERELSHVNSYLTSDSDLQFFKYCQRLNLLNDTSTLDEESDSSTKSKKASYKKLLRSYSLQRSRIGLATDYKKRPNVLRLRIESEQLLINFQSTKDLIDWNTAMGIGRDVSLDLNEREMPRFRTVPRRRRRRRSTSLTGSGSNLLARTMGAHESRNRLRSNSEPTSRLKGKLSKLKLKLSGSKDGSVDGSMKQNNKDRSQSFSLNSSASTARLPFATSELSRLNLGASQLPSFEDNRFDGSYENLDDLMDDDEDEDYYDDEEALELVARSSLINRENLNRQRVGSARQQNQSSAPIVITDEPTSARHNDYEEDDIENLSDLHHSDDEDEDDDGDEVVLDELDVLESSGIVQNQHLSLDHKWEPIDYKFQSKRKFYRNCLRCIKPLTMDDSWVNKLLCRPTTLSPLNFAYLRVKYSNNNSAYNPPSTIASFFNSSSSSSSLVSLNSLAAQGSSSRSSGFRKRTFSIKDVNGLNLPDSALTKVPNHFLKEFIVGSHGLIPKDV